MTQGKPMHKEEYRFIWETRKQFPSLVARQLSANYSHLNGGFRGKKTVSELQAEMIQYETFRDWWQAKFNPTPQKIEEIEKKIQLPDLRKKRIKKSDKIPA